jgi:hypothetical protein
MIRYTDALKKTELWNLKLHDRFSAGLIIHSSLMLINRNLNKKLKVCCGKSLDGPFSVAYVESYKNLEKFKRLLSIHITV